MTRKTAASLLFLTGILFLGLTVNPLLFQSYWENESDYVLHANFPLRLIPDGLARDQGLVYYYLLHFWIRLFGTNEATTRSYSILFGLGAVFFLYRLGRILFRERSVAILASLFLATSSLLVEFSQEAKHWTMFVFLTISSLFFLYRWFGKSRSKDLFLFLSLGVLNLYTCLYAFFIFPLQLVFLASQRGRKRVVWISIIVGLAAMLLESRHLWDGFNYVKIYNQQPVSPATFPDFFLSMYVQLFHNLGPGLIPAPVTMGLGLAFVFFLIGLLRMETREALLISFLILVPLVVSARIAGTTPIRNRYFIHLIPLFWLSVSWGISSIKRWDVRAVVILLILVPSSLSLFNYFKFSRKEDWRSAIAYLRPKLQEGDIVIVTPSWMKAGYRVYTPASYPLLGADQPKLEELTSFKRAWVLSANSDAKIEEDRFPPFDQRKFNRVSLRGFNLSGGGFPISSFSKIQNPIFDFRKELESAEVWAQPFGEGPPVRFPHFGKEAFYLAGEERGSGGEGILFDHWQRYPVFIPQGHELWQIVGRTVQRSGGVLREAIWAHPYINGEVIINYPRVVLGRKLSGFYGLTDLAVSHGWAPVRFSVYLGEDRVYEDLKKNSAGWKEFSIDTSSLEGKGRSVQFRIEASNIRWRHFCFNAFITKEKILGHDEKIDSYRG